MVGKNEIGGLEKTMKGARDGLEARRRTLENYCSAVRFLIQPWGSFGRRQTVVVVSRVIFDAHAWMAGDLSCVQARSTATKWRRPAWLSFSSSIICENL
jgi:hypothetical protein